VRVLVLGAGVVGVTTAYYLVRAGHAVTIVDRQPGAGLETSFANGGQISANHATPWATPGTPWKALRWLGRSDAPLLFHLRADPALWAWTVRFLANCTHARMHRNLERALRVALYSRRQLAALCDATGIEYERKRCGILHFFRDRREFEAALPQVEPMNRIGCSRHVVGPDLCLEIEPALAGIGEQLVGGIFSPDDESGDALLFTRRLAEICRGEGATAEFEVGVRALVAGNGRIGGVETDRGRLVADAYVVALGSYSPGLLKPLGIRLPVYPAKGYSVTLPVTKGKAAPMVALIDDEFKMVYSRLGKRLRVAGTAEFAGYDLTVDERRARSLLAKAAEIFGNGVDPARAEFWCGLRPSTPDGVPVMGATRYRNLFLNTGHGTLGWTMACGAGRLVADLVGGGVPEVPLEGLGIERFG
jgi:D-amino-acid dehydrogenase